MAESTDITQTYERVRSLMVDFLFSLNRKVIADTAIILEDGDLLAEHRDFVTELQQARRDAIQDLCVHLTLQDVDTATYPPVMVRHWLLGQMRECESTGNTMAWHGYKFVETGVLMFEERFESRVFGA